MEWLIIVAVALVFYVSSNGSGGSLAAVCARVGTINGVAQSSAGPANR
jgi:hypothetical protein